MRAMSVRVIARLDVKGPNVVRGVNLEGLRVVGHPGEMAQRYASAGIDEIIFIDTVATLYGRNKLCDVIRDTAQKLFIPLAVGGGVRALQDVEELLNAGADKITINSAALERPRLIGEIADAFGSQCVVCSIEAKQRDGQHWEAYATNGRDPTGRDAILWARECYERGAGELLVVSIDRDGTRKGGDAELLNQIAEAVPLPIIGSGGPGTPQHVVDMIQRGGVQAVALGSLLHFNLASVAVVKAALSDANIACRVDDLYQR